MLNKDIFKMAKICSDKGIRVKMETNGTLFNESDYKHVVRYFDEIEFSVDGADAKTYEKYRVGGNFDKVLANIEGIVRQRGISKRPRIIIQFLVMKHNQHQKNEILRLGRSLGIDGVRFKSVLIQPV